MVAGDLFRSHFEEHAFARRAKACFGCGRAQQFPAHAVGEIQLQADGRAVRRVEHFVALGQRQLQHHLALQHHLGFVHAGAQGGDGLLDLDLFEIRRIRGVDHVAEVLHIDLVLVELQHGRCALVGHEPVAAQLAIRADDLHHGPCVLGEQLHGVGHGRGCDGRWCGRGGVGHDGGWLLCRGIASWGCTGGQHDCCGGDGGQLDDACRQALAWIHEYSLFFKTM